MNTYNKFQRLILDSEISAIVLGNLSAGDFEVIKLGDGDPNPPHEHAARKERNLGFVGVLALGADGCLRSALEVPLPDYTVAALARTFGQPRGGAIYARPSGELTNFCPAGVSARRGRC